MALVVDDKDDELELLDTENPLETGVVELFCTAVGTTLGELDPRLPYSAPLEKVGTPIDVLCAVVFGDSNDELE